MTRRPAKTRAVLLFEVLIALIMLAVLAAIIAQLFLLCCNTQRDSQKSTAQIQHVDAAILFLRRDIWNAASIKCAAPDQLDILGPAIGAISWHYRPDGTLIRTAAGITHAWTNLPPATFSLNGPLLKLNFQIAPQRNESLTLPSQQLLAGARK